ncbi:hypothetical protein BaRGS_00033473, partial [Batillaria attramentaria]
MSCPFKAMQRDAEARRQDKTSNASSNGSSESSGVKVTFAEGVPVLDTSRKPSGPETYITLEEGPVLKGWQRTRHPNPVTTVLEKGRLGYARPATFSTTSSLGSEGDLGELTAERKGGPERTYRGSWYAHHTCVKSAQN